MAIFAFFWQFSNFTASGRSFQYFIKMFERSLPAIPFMFGWGTMKFARPLVVGPSNSVLNDNRRLQASRCRM